MTTAGDAFINNQQCSPQKLSPRLNVCNCASNSLWPSEKSQGSSTEGQRICQRQRPTVVPPVQCWLWVTSWQKSLSAQALDVLCRGISSQGQHVELSKVSIPCEREKSVVELSGRRKLQGTDGTGLAGWDKGEWAMTLSWKKWCFIMISGSELYGLWLATSPFWAFTSQLQTPLLRDAP